MISVYHNKKFLTKMLIMLQRILIPAQYREVNIRTIEIQ